MNILILGSGGREHALAWAVKQNPKVDRLIVAPGNAGIAMLAECADIDILDGTTVVTFCAENAIDFIVVGPEAPLAAGVADATRLAGILTFGPSAAAAQLEASKAFTKDICDACGARCSGCGASFGAAAYYGCSACATVNFCGACERNGACEAHAPSPGTANSRDGRSHVFVRTRLGINATLQGLRAAHCS